jgi:hypothetical protein
VQLDAQNDDDHHVDQPNGLSRYPGWCTAIYPRCTTIFSPHYFLALSVFLLYTSELDLTMICSLKGCVMKSADSMMGIMK